MRSCSPRCDPNADANRPTEEDQPTGLKHRRQTSRPCFPFCLAMLPFVLVTTTAWLANPNVYATQHACARVSCDLRMSEAAAKAAWLAKNAPAWGPPRRSSTPAQPIAVPAPAPVAPRPAFATSASTTTREEEAKRAWLAKNKPAWGPPAATRAAQTSLSPPTASARLTEEEAKRAWLARNKPAWGPPAKTREAPNLQAPIGQSPSPPFVHAPLSFFALDQLTPKGSRRSQGGKVDIGDPHDFTRPLCEDSWNGAEVGSWACTPGGWESPKLRPTTETFLVLSGKGAVTDADGAAHPFGPGDVVVLPKHWCGRWDITEHLHKLWVVHDHPDVAGAAYGTVRAMVAPVPTSTLPVIQGPLHKVPANPPANVARTIYDVGPTRVGFLSCAPGSFAIAARPAAECLFVVDGVFFLTNADGSARRCTAGDTVVLPQGWAGGWDIVEPTSKVWVEVE
mmetsp:Transcript_33162/g.107243  ORF Transcript_33162/g.107243 Transcript_33162/m.107243 type:complete len:452 (-) Transcript_33162:291-1646(-)